MTSIFNGINLAAYWEPPSKKNYGVGDIDPNPIYAAVGRALTTWEWAEDILANIYSRLLFENHLREKYIFGKITSHKTRADCIKKAADVFFESSLEYQFAKPELDLLVAHFQQASYIRNDIAHWVVQCVSFKNSQQCFLVPSESNSKKLDEFVFDGKNSADFDAYEIKYRYNSTDIEGYSIKFIELKDQAIKVLDMLPAIPIKTKQ